jgi:hypothetical protein
MKMVLIRKVEIIFTFHILLLVFQSSSKSAVSLASKPYSSATYKISNLVLPVENSTESYVLGRCRFGWFKMMLVFLDIRLEKIALGLFNDFFGNIDDRSYTVAPVTSIKTCYNEQEFPLGAGAN